jgi:hypothetical protein
MVVSASITRGTSTTAAVTLGSAELSIQQAIRSPTATANGNDRQTLLWAILPCICHSQPNPSKHVPTTSKLDQNPKMKAQVRTRPE